MDEERKGREGKRKQEQCHLQMEQRRGGPARTPLATEALKFSL